MNLLTLSSKWPLTFLLFNSFGNLVFRALDSIRYRSSLPSHGIYLRKLTLFVGLIPKTH